MKIAMTHLPGSNCYIIYQRVMWYGHPSYLGKRRHKLPSRDEHGLTLNHFLGLTTYIRGVVVPPYEAWGNSGEMS